MSGLLRYRAWKRSDKPARILVIRYQALGDTVITLPYIQHLRVNHPTSRIDLLTRQEDQPIPESLELYDRVIPVYGGRNARLQFIWSLCLLPWLWSQRYQVVLDLQNHKISRIVRVLLFPEAWCQFDRVSPIPAGDRTRLAIASVGLGDGLQYHFKYRHTTDGLIQKLKREGWNGAQVVLLNPAGFFPSRNWPISNYIQFAKCWLKEEEVQFLILGLPALKAKAQLLKEALGNQLIDLTGATTSAEAFGLMQMVRFTLAEDSGLMHMSWVQQVPTLALFGSTRSDWSRPLGAHSGILDSSDLPCGNCMAPTCRLATLHCLTRYSGEYVFKKAKELLQQQG